MYKGGKDIDDDDDNGDGDGETCTSKCMIARERKLRRLLIMISKKCN